MKNKINLIFLFIICSLSSSCFLSNNLEEKKFNEFIKRNDIYDISYDNVKFSYVYEDSWVGDTTGYCYYYVKFDNYPDIFFKQFDDYEFSTKNKSFEKVINRSLLSYKKYEKFNEEYKINFEKEYLYSNKPIIYYPEDNAMIILYRYSLMKGVDITDDIAYTLRYRTNQNYFEGFINDSKLNNIKYEDLCYFDSNINLEIEGVYKPEICFYAFDLRNNKNAINQLDKISKYEITNSKDIYEKHEKEMSLVDIPQEYIIDDECYYFKYKCPTFRKRTENYSPIAHLLYFKESKKVIVLYIDNYFIL